MAIEPGKYDTELVRRTIELIDSYKGKYDITLLMNALLSLIILPNESNKRRKLKYFDENIYEINDIRFVISSPMFTFDPQDGKYLFKNLLRRVRNGIAHQRIETISKDGKWTGVIIQDLNKDETVGLHMELSIEELKIFANFIANRYLIEALAK